MTISEFEIKKYEKELEKFISQRRPPAHMRDKIDLGYRMINQSIELFEIRPQWRNPSVKQEHTIAKATYTKSGKCWKIYWQRADLKWHRYDPVPTVKTLEDFLQTVTEDKHACFFG